MVFSLRILDAASVVLTRGELLDLDAVQTAQIDADGRCTVGCGPFGESLDATMLALSMMQPLPAELVIAQRVGARFKSHLCSGRECPDRPKLGADRAIALQRLIEVEIDRERDSLAMTASDVGLGAHGTKPITFRRRGSAPDRRHRSCAST